MTGTGCAAKQQTPLRLRHLRLGRGDLPAEAPGLGEPFFDRIGHVGERFFGCLAVGHATGQVRHMSQIAAAMVKTIWKSDVPTTSAAGTRSR